MLDPSASVAADRPAGDCRGAAFARVGAADFAYAFAAGRRIFEANLEYFAGPARRALLWCWTRDF